MVYTIRFSTETPTHLRRPWGLTFLHRNRVRFYRNWVYFHRNWVGHTGIARETNLKSVSWTWFLWKKVSLLGFRTHLKIDQMSNLCELQTWKWPKSAKIWTLFGFVNPTEYWTIPYLYLLYPKILVLACHTSSFSPEKNNDLIHVIILFQYSHEYLIHAFSFLSVELHWSVRRLFLWNMQATPCWEVLWFSKGCTLLQETVSQEENTNSWAYEIGALKKRQCFT